MLQQYLDHGSKYLAAGGYQSGYNELVISGEHWEASLPHSVEAFFIVQGGTDIGLGRQVHREFLARYDVSDDVVPLLELVPGSWAAPFQPA